MVCSRATWTRIQWASVVKYRAMQHVLLFQRKRCCINHCYVAYSFIVENHYTKYEVKPTINSSALTSNPRMS